MDCCRLKSSSPSIKVSHSLYLLHQGAGLIIIYIGSKMVTLSRTLFAGSTECFIVWIPQIQV